MSLRRRSMEFLQRRLAGEAPPVRLAFWDGETFDFAPSPSVIITLHSKRILRVLLTGDMGRLGEAYVRGEIGVEGRLQNVLRLGIRIAERLGRSRALRRLGAVAARRPRFRHSRKRDASAINL